MLRDVALGLVVAWNLVIRDQVERTGALGAATIDHPRHGPSTVARWPRSHGEVWFDVVRAAPQMVGLAVAIGVAVALRNRAPRVAAAAVALLTALYLLLGGSYFAALVAPAICVFTLARVRPADEWWIPLVTVALMLWAGHWAEPWLGLNLAATWFQLVFGLMVIMVPALVRVMRRDRHAAMTERRAEELRRVADTERLRLARDVHDVVGHSLSMISLQAGVALHVIDRNPEQVRASLQAIRDASRTSLADLRHTLGALRTEAGGAEGADDGAEPEAVRTPTPDLAAINQLVAGVRAAGREVALVSTGDPHIVPAGHQHAAYRIVQESLTNAVRHAPEAAITVNVRVADRLVIDVSDTGDGPGEVTPGHGLLGITERVTALGGTVRYGRVGEGGSGGFTVHAEIPLPKGGHDE